MSCFIQSSKECFEPALEGRSKICRLFSLLLISAFLVIAAGCTNSSKQGQTKIFLITLDTTRADHINFTKGNSQTPNLAELAADGIYFPNAYSLIPITLPSHVSMFYSLPPHALKIYNNGIKLKTKLPSLASLLEKKGYETAAVISLGTLGSNFGMNKGFSHFNENYRKSYLFYKTAQEVNEDAITLIKKLKDKNTFFWIHYSDPHEPYFPPFFEGRFFLTINKEIVFEADSIDRALVKHEFKLLPGINKVVFKTEIPHGIEIDPNLDIDVISYESFSLNFDSSEENVSVEFPEHWAKIETRGYLMFNTHRCNSELLVTNKSDKAITAEISFIHRMKPSLFSMRELYKKEIHYMDEQIGRLISFLKTEGLYDQAVFVIVGDHGEGLGEYRNHVGHIDYLNPHYTKVPLIICGAGIEERGYREDLISCLDVAPTILALAGKGPLRHMKGQSLLKPIPERILHQETFRPEAISDAFSIIDFPHQIIFYPERVEDRLEYINLQNEKFKSMKIRKSPLSLHLKQSLIKKIYKRVRGLSSIKSEAAGTAQKEKDILKSLGYIH